MIVKIQRSLATNKSNPQVLIYNKSKSIFWQGDLPKEISNFLQGRVKVYADAENQLDEEGRILINDIVEGQDW